MDPAFHIETERLALRTFRLGDGDAFYAMNGDPRVMEFFPSPLTRTDSDALLARFIELGRTEAYAFLAVTERTHGDCLGFVGLKKLPFDSLGEGLVEIGWRLRSSVWNRGYATEGARACLRWAFDDLHLGALVSMTAKVNIPSQRVMQKIGMQRNVDEDFHHPSLPNDERLGPHVLYRISDASWREQTAHQEDAR